MEEASSGGKPKLLFLSSQIPFRESRAGGAKRLYFLAKGLEAYFEVYLVSLDGAGEHGLWKSAGTDFRNFLFLPLDVIRSGGWSRILRAEVDVHREVRSNRELLGNFLGARTFDVTLCAYPHSLSLSSAIPRERQGRRVYLEDDLLLEVSRKRYRCRPKGIRKAGYYLRFRQLLKFYRKSLEGISLLVNISEHERRLSRRYFPQLQSVIFKHGIPLSEHPVLPLPEGGISFGFIGNFRHAPNLDALEWSLSEFLPLLRARFPGARMVVAGTGFPSRIIADSAGSPEVEILDNVQDLRDFYSRFQIFLNPVRSGRGLRTKLVEAAAFGRPILSTPVGAEGLEDLNIGLATKAAEFLDCAADLMAEKERCLRFISANRARIESNYSLESQVEELWKRLKPG